MDREGELFAEHQPAPEGPVVGPAGWILNVCSESRPDHDWSARGGDISATNVARPRETRKVFSTSTPEVPGIPAALAYGPDQALYVTDEGRRAIVRVGTDGSISDHISTWDGGRLNGPNDLTFDPTGNLFFTDPWGSGPDRPTGNLFGYDWASGELHRLRTGLRFPNGVVVRDSRLYVAETITNRIFVWDVTGPGQADNETEFCVCPDQQGLEWGGPDGMCFDDEGNLYVAHIGSGSVVIYDRGGREVDRIPTGGPTPTNVCFGGPDYDQLFVTQDDLGAVLRYDLGVRGHRLNFCPSLAAGHPWAAVIEAVEPAT
jgi:sugar lactone lactonase YvrE